MLQCSVIDELKLIESVSSLHSLIPQFLFDYFKRDFNQNILKNLIDQLDNLIESVDANNSFRVLTLNDDTINRSGTNANNLSTVSSSQSHSSSLLINASKSILLDIAIRVDAFFQSYAGQINEHISLLQLESAKFIKLKFTEPTEILVYQRAILVERFTPRHYNLFNLLFKNVFDIYQRMSSPNEYFGDNESESAYENSILEHFHQINRIL